MQLTQFNGGLVTRVAPHLLGLSQATTCINVDLSAGALRALAGPSSTGVATQQRSFYSVSQAMWVSADEATEWLDFQDKLIATSASSATVTIAGNVLPLGLNAPTTAPVGSVGAGGLTGTYQYAYSYVNDTNGIESSISPITSELVLANNAVTFTFSAPTDASVTHINLYRIGGIWSDFLLVATIAVGALTYTDNTADAALVGRILASVDNTPAPAGVRFICERQGTFFGAVGSRLYYTKGDGMPYYWPATNYINVFEPITALAASTLGVYVFTQNAIFLLAGNTALSFSLITVSRSQGCISYSSIAAVNDGVLFASNDGICLLTNTTVTVLSQALLRKEVFNITRACLHDDVYYAQLATGLVLMCGLRLGDVKFSYLSCNSTDIYTGNDKLYVTVNGSRKELNGTALSYTYKTGKLTEGQISNLKTYNKFYLAVDGTVTVKLYLDGALANEQVCTTGTTELVVPQHMREAYYFEAEFTGTGEVQELYYNVMPRQM